MAHVKLRSSIAGLTGFYTALLEPFGTPLIFPGVAPQQRLKIAEMHEIMKNSIRIAETKVIFIDEFQHIYSKRKTQSANNQKFVDHIKLLMEEARVAIIPVGVLSVEDFLNLDSQLVGRCPIKEYSRLGYWEFPSLDMGTSLKKFYEEIQEGDPQLSSKEIENLAQQKAKFIQEQIIDQRTRFRNFLKGFEEYLPFPQPSHLSSIEKTQIIFDKVKFTKIEEGELGKTNVRKISQFVRIAADLASSKKHHFIHKEDLLEAEI